MIVNDKSQSNLERGHIAGKGQLQQN